MTVKELRSKSGMTQAEYAKYFGISKRSVESWEGGQRKIVPCLLRLMEYKLRNEGLID